MIYLDNNSTTQPDHNMLNAAQEVIYRSYGNPSSQHEIGMDARDILEDARVKVAKVINARPSEIIFTSGGTEANNLALNKTWYGATEDSVITFKTEHSSVWTNCGYELDVDEGGLADTSPLERAFHITPKRTIVSCMLVNNETGVIQDPENSLFDLKQSRGFILHVDAVQAFGKIPIDVSNTPIDMLSISAHKIHGLKGVGALYLSKEMQELKHSKISARNLIEPIFRGGPQERGLRPGTPNMIGIYSLGYMANKLISNTFYMERIKKIKHKRNLLERLLDDVAQPNGNTAHRADHVSNLYFPELKTNAEEFVDYLSERGVYASVGSACNSNMMDKPSRVLTAMYGEKSDRSNKSLRFSLSVNTTDYQIGETARIIKEGVKNG
jgi:cysteine desulfurase